MSIKLFLQYLLFLLFSLLSTQLLALTFPLPKNGDSVVGKIQEITTYTGENIHQISEKY